MDDLEAHFRSLILANLDRAAALLGPERAGRVLGALQKEIERRLASDGASARSSEH